MSNRTPTISLDGVDQPDKATEPTTRYCPLCWQGDAAHAQGIRADADVRQELELVIRWQAASRLLRMAAGSTPTTAFAEVGLLSTPKPRESW